MAYLASRSWSAARVLDLRESLVSGDPGDPGNLAHVPFQVVGGVVD
jgi:hypothetical protein